MPGALGAGADSRSRQEGKLKRVLYVDVAAEGGGSAVSLRTLLHGLNRRMYSPVVAFGHLRDRASWKDEDILVAPFIGLDNFDFFPAGWNIRWIYQFLLFVIRFPIDFLRALFVVRKVRPQIVHLNGGQAMTFALAARVWGVPVVWHIRELVARNSLGRLQDRVYARLAKEIVVPSGAVAGRLPASRSRITIIPNAVLHPKVSREDLKAFKDRHGIQRGDFVVLLLAHALTVQKGYLFLAEVSELMKPADRVKFLLAGHLSDPPASAIHRLYRRIYRSRSHPGGEKGAILRRWENLVAERKAAFTGFVDPAIAVAACHLVVCPNTLAESFGRTVVEANIQAKPVIAANLPSFVELIEHEKTGWLLPLQPFLWARTITKLSRHRGLVARAGRAAASRCGRFDAAVCARQVMAVYDRALGG